MKDDNWKQHDINAVDWHNRMTMVFKSKHALSSWLSKH